jgi:hypothetical protein
VPFCGHGDGIGRLDEVKLAFMDHVKIKMAGRMTYVRKEPQRPSVVDVYNDHIFSDVKKGKTHGEIHTGSA